ncbi:MAG: EboA domain-containing protein [Chitinophagaceae bacterium]|nr:EboA domain-containing protein [Chitinophagaceae bacterium]
MYAYPVERLKAIIAEIIQQQVTPGVWSWLQEQQGLTAAAAFNKTFVLIPRKTGKTAIIISAEHSDAIQQIRPGFSIAGYTIDRLCRVWLLLQLDSTNEENYLQAIENLFSAAEVNELVALYGALPVLAYPQKWTGRCAEGIRSNIGVVLETIICDNPYPSAYLGEAAWNQLVLKAFFTDKDIDRIIGIDERANKSLADTLCDYAHERWAASRAMNPQLWRCVAPFIDAENFSDIQKMANSSNPVEQKAALLACNASHYQPAKTLLNQYPEINKTIQSGKLNWHSLAQEDILVA